MRNACRTVLSIVFVIGLLFFFSFSFQMRYEGPIEEQRKVEKHAIGSPWPWFERRSETVTKPSGEQMTRSDQLKLDSPAWLVLLVAIGAGYGVYRLRPRPTEGGA